MSFLVEEAVIGIETKKKIDYLILRQKLINQFARFTQFLVWPLTFLVFHLFFNLKISGRNNLVKIKSPFLIVCNHVSFYDSFIFRLALGLWTSHLPLRFMAVDKFDWKFLNRLASVGLIDFVYSLFGVFTVVPGKGIRSNLIEASRIIKAGGNIVIYPEGGIITQHAVGPFRKGAAVLMQETGVPVIPVSFKIIEKGIRDRLIVKIGSEISYDPRLSENELTYLLYNSVNKLYGEGIK
jgi:1-acyl-sn-glycerol-3-phosphate acyltransferase